MAQDIAMFHSFYIVAVQYDFQHLAGYAPPNKNVMIPSNQAGTRWL